MSRLLTGLLAAQLLLLPAQGFCEPTNASAQANSQVADDVAAETIAEFLVPSRMQADFDLEGCAHTFRNGLFKLDGFAEYETEVPGVTEYMISVTVGYCEKHIPPVYEDWKNKMRVRVQESMTPVEMQRLYPALSATVSEMQATSFRYLPGEPVAKGLVRYEAAWKELIKRFALRIESFKQNSDDARISSKLLNLQNEVLSEMEKHTSEILDISSKASDTGIDAANAYAKLRGKEPFFGD